jgi:hypothetical protein
MGSRKEDILMSRIFLLLVSLMLLVACGQIATKITEDNDLDLEVLNTRSPLGDNPSSISPFTNNYPFIDAFKAARAWTTYAGDPKLNLDDHGWIKSFSAGQGVFTQVFNSTDGRYPKGDYILLYEGQGNLSSDPQDDGDFIGSPTVSGNTSRQIVRVTNTTSKGIAFGYSQTNPNNYIRNVRLIMPGGMCRSNAFRWAANASNCPGGDYVSFEKIYTTQIFHPTYLSRLRPYSTLRFMGWMETNGSIQTSWANRPKVTDAFWSTKKGAPLEIMIELANRLDVDMWVNMPHAADNAYMAAFARLTKARLESGRKVYIEYSNEIWLDRDDTIPTDDDRQHEYAIEQGGLLGLVSTSECNRVGVNRCKELKFERFQVKRSLEMFTIWQQNFGTKNLVRVMASTLSNTSSELLRYRNAYNNIDAFAVAPYFGDIVNRFNIDWFKSQNYTVSSYFNRLNGDLLNDMRNDIRRQKTIIASTGKMIPLVAYEGGQILTQEGTTDTAIETLFDAINRNPRMKQTYLNYLSLWKTESGQLFNHFFNSGNWSEFGRWGALEYLTQSRRSAPKFDGLMTFIEQNPRWW